VSRHVLLTGFEPFGTHAVNPSELLVRSFEGRVVAGRAIDTRVFPVETRTLHDRIEAALQETQPEFVIGLGYAPGRTALALERIGVNVLDFETPDAVGTVRKDDPIQRGGPDGRFSTLPASAILGAWTELGIPGYVSDTAGTDVSNQWLYETLAVTANTSPPVPVGFVSVPALPPQAVQLGAERTPSMTLDLMRRGIETAIESVAQWLEAKPAAPARAAQQLWIPRGLRQVER
jgi:pyroglutamyl-peptidase